MTVLTQHARVIRRKLIDRISSTAVAATVDGFEAKSAPTHPGIHCVVVNGPGRTLPNRSSIAWTAIWQSYTVHFFKRLPLAEGAQENEQLDPELSDARDTVLNALHENIVFGSGVELDVVGMGDVLRWSPGYLDWDGNKYRSETITAGFVVHNALEQVRA